MSNKKGEEMVEAAMVLPLLILVIVSMLFVMVHDYDVHQKQMQIHKELIQSWTLPSTVFKIETKKIETSSKISGGAEFWMKEMKVYRSYVFSPAACIRTGEMISFDERT